MNTYFSLMFAPLSHWGILLGGTAIFFLLGWLWYSPITPIGKKWISYFPMPKKKDMPTKSQFSVMLLFQLLMGFCITWLIMAFWNILGLMSFLWDCPAHEFCTPELLPHIWLTNFEKTLLILKMLIGVIIIKDFGHWYFEKKPLPLVLIGSGYYLVGMLGVCFLLAGWY